MNIVFISNFFNHHQVPLCDALRTKCDGFIFVETESMPRERKALGYPELRRDYVVQAAGNEAQVRKLLREADLVIAGSAPEHWLRQRIRAGKPLLRYSERLLKNGPEPLKYFPRFLRLSWRNPPGKPIWLLCAGGSVAADYARFGLFRDRCLKWGYFPETRRYPDVEALLENKISREMVWCGRFLPWKHPEHALEAARRLKGEGHSFRLTYLGCGELEEELQKLTKEYRLEDCVEFCGPQGPERVRESMERSGIFLFTSDGREGWGAVLNEAMNSGCAVIASHAAGAVPYLLRDGENGLVYPSGDVDMLTQRLRQLLQTPQKQRSLGRKAYRTIVNTWNAETAAQRLIASAEHILSEKSSPCLYEDGPCSSAEETSA